MGWARTKYLLFPVAVVGGGILLHASGLVRGEVSVGEILDTFFVAVFVAVTWFYADETALMRKNAARETLLLEQAREMSRARLAFRPIPAQPPVHASVISSLPDIDAATMGVELVNAGGTAAFNVRLEILFYQAGLSYTSNGVETRDSDRNPSKCPVLPALLPGESRTFSVPMHWRGLHYSSSRLTAHIVGEYQDGVGTVPVDETVDISKYMEQAARTRMLRVFN